MRVHMRAVGFALAAVMTMVMAGTPASAAPDRTLVVESGQRATWLGAEAQGVSNYYYWDPVGAGDVGPFESTKCTKDSTTYCEQILVEYRNPLTDAEKAAGKTSKVSATTIWLDGFFAPGGPVNDFDLLVYESDATGARGPLIASDGDMQNTTRELVSFDVVTTTLKPSKYVLIDVVYYQVVNGDYTGHLTF